MFKGMKKHVNKEQGKTLKHEAPRSINQKATQNKNNTGTTALERSVALTTGGLKIFSPVDRLHTHSVLTICTQTGTCDTRSGDLVFFSAAFDEFSLFTKN